jgi:hypothetical protein
VLAGKAEAAPRLAVTTLLPEMVAPWTSSGHRR